MNHRMLVAHYLSSIQEESWREYVPIMVLISSHILTLCFVKQLLRWKTPIILIFSTVHSKKSDTWNTLCFTNPKLSFSFHVNLSIILFQLFTSILFRDLLKNIISEKTLGTFYLALVQVRSLDMLMTARLRSSWDFLKYMTVKLDWALVFSSTPYFQTSFLWNSYFLWWEENNLHIWNNSIFLSRTVG